MTPSADTIVAIATAPGRAGVGILRVSGALAPAIAAAVTGRALQPRVATVATFRDSAGQPLDQGLALLFVAPHSYTGEHVLELHGHGGSAVLRVLLDRCVELGARLAQPGEFTLRAFLSGKLDLAQAEGVADLIEAGTAAAARAAARSLTGVFSAHIRALVGDLIALRMLTEATLDFPDEEIDFLASADASGRLAAIAARLAQVLTRAQQGALLRDGLTVVLIGEPNVGKSSLLNQLAGDDVAIVTSIAGTTRDAISSAIEIDGIPLTIVDTAGLRATDDPIETIGIERTWAAVAGADLALMLVDARSSAGGLLPAAAAIRAQLPPAMPCLIVHNKVDLCAGAAPHVEHPAVAGATATTERAHIYLSAKTGAGIAALRHEILRVVGAREDLEGVFLARERHIVALRGAQGHLAAAAGHLSVAPPPLELFAEELRRTQTTLGAITGEFSADDLLGVIFSRFCIGK